MRLPDLCLCDQQERHAVDLPKLEAAAVSALSQVLSRPGTGPPVLPELGTVEIVFVDDATIARVHGEFLNDPTPTDVITFHHGEILISTDTAVRQAAENGQPLQRELALYLIHGLLHLNGHEDETAAGAEGMRRIQDAVLHAIWPLPEGPEVP
ncbi:MAG: rRNA maturation RNase YbeY [Verrucomicrobiales bacterium]|nr:rRNA maturation RNase YbeY [Verrucomicrobiales bacterium]